MTDKMAMRYLSPVKSLMKKLDFDRHYIEAFDLAIKALEDKGYAQGYIDGQTGADYDEREYD